VATQQKIIACGYKFLYGLAHLVVTSHSPARARRYDCDRRQVSF